MDEDIGTLNTVRGLMIEQLRALRSATPETLATELQRSKGMAELTQTLVNTAKVEVDYLVATGQQEGGSAFLKDALPAPGATTTTTTTTAPGPGNGITSITRHRMGA